MDKKYSRGTWISFLLHVIIAACLLNLHSVNMLVPSRSDGMEVEVISPPDVVKQRYVPVKAPQYNVQNTNNADVKLKQPDTTPVPKVTPVPQKPVAATPTPPPTPNPVAPPPSPKPTPKPKKPATNSQINDLLNDIAPSKGNSKGKATGGSNLGTSDTDNMQANYADLVIARVRPFIIVPDGTDPDAKAVVEITLLPNMQIYNVRLVKSSGNPDYDNNVQQAINRAGTFPPLPDGANFTDFRKIKITFKPQ